MAFVNEYVTPEDREKYGLNELDKMYQLMFLPMSKSDSITIDRARESYLRLVKLGREVENEGNIWYFSFYANGNTYTFKFYVEEAGNLKEHASRKYKILKIYPDETGNISHSYPLVKEALTAYKELGNLSECNSFEAFFDF